MILTANVLLIAVFAVLAIAVSMQLGDTVLRRARQNVSWRVMDASEGMPTGNMPLFRCRPSQFWLTRYLRMPRFCNSTRAMWVAVGMACNALADLMS